MENQIVLTGKEAMEYHLFKRELDKFYKYKGYEFSITGLMNTVFEIFREYTAARAALEEVHLYLRGLDFGENEDFNNARDVAVEAESCKPENSKIRDWNSDLNLLTKALTILSLISWK